MDKNISTPIESRASEERDEKVRGNWGRQIEFTLSCIGYAVGLGNLWRFPYLCMRNGGGAFLIPYFTCLLLCGVPLFFMELCLGQFSALSPISVWKFCPIFRGVGWGMLIVSAVITIYYNTILAWVLYYLGMSLRKDVPWKTCDNSWNTPDCYVVGENRSEPMVTHTWNGTSGQEYSSAEEFWNRKVLAMSDGIENMGSIKWDLLLSFMGAWIITFMCLCKGVQSSGKVVYVTALLPYLLLTILLIRGVTLPGSLNGIKYYIIPQWSRLGEFNVWTDACLQIFYSLGPGWGGLITMSSYNRFHNNCLKDAVIVCLTCAGSSLFAGFAIFSIIGYMAHEAQVPVDQVISEGPGLAFIAYPEAISKLPISPFWAVCFFLTLLTLGIDSQFGTFETVTSGLLDEFPKLLRKRKLLFVVFMCILLCLVGLPFVTEGGIYIFQIVDWYAGAFSVMVIGLFECVVVSYVYGIGAFYSDITMMLKKPPSKVWAVLWCFVTPAILFSLLVVSAVQMVPPRNGDYTYPDWAIGIGWILAMLSIIPLPIVIVYTLIKAKGNLIERIRTSLKPKSEWGPQDERYIAVYKRSMIGVPWLERMRFRTSLAARRENQVFEEVLTPFKTDV